MKYRAEIDGLRALAVLPVILFHAGFEIFSGGYVGVDVFFVISGYLITTILIEDIERDRFSIANFYERRARRILPALFFVMLLCIPFAWMWMLPSQLKDFLQSVAAVSLFSSNVLFWRESGYFDAAAEEKPLLHTWSLAVEEQYYVLFPIFLFLAWRLGKRRVFWMIVVFAGASLALSEWGWRHLATANFYLAPTRAWELFAGSIAAFIVLKRGVKANNALALLGLAAILFAIFAYDGSTPFPSVYALIPVVGVVLLVLFADQSTFVARLLSTKLLVGIGLISYSAYLWHQPLFAFARICSVDAPNPTIMLMLAAAAIVLAAISWRTVEVPMRNRRLVTRSQVFATSLVGVLLFAGGGLLGQAYWEKLAPGRFNPLNVEINIAEYNPDNRALRLASWDWLKEISRDKSYGVNNNEFDDTRWFPEDDHRQRILLIGNSFSKDLFNALVSGSETDGAFAVARYGAQIRDLRDGHALWQSPNFRDAHYVIIVSRYEDEDVDNVDFVVKKMKAEGKEVLLVKNAFEFEEYRTGEWSLIDKIVYESRQTGLGAPELSRQINETYFDHYKRNITSDRVKRINKQLEFLAERLGVRLLDRMDYICNEDEKVCYAVNERLEKYICDHAHHSLKGAEFFGKRIEAIDWLNLDE